MKAQARQGHNWLLSFLSQLEKFLVVMDITHFVSTYYAYVSTTIWVLPFEFTHTFCFHQDRGNQATNVHGNRTLNGSSHLPWSPITHL